MYSKKNNVIRNFWNMIMERVVSVTFHNKVNFNYKVLSEDNPAVIRGEFFRPGNDDSYIQLGIILEVNRPNIEEAIGVIHNCSKLIADEIVC